MSTIINVSNRLPVTVEDDQIRKSSGGLVSALDGMAEEGYALMWFGWPGGQIDDPAVQRRIERTLIEEHGCHPVFLTDEEARGHYEGFSNSSLWPILHYMPNYMRYESTWWDDYRRVNERFAEQVLASTGPEDLVWIHDYHLMLLPALLRAEMPSLRIGFFLHTPFPSYEMFRCHPRRIELIEGLLGADQIGFHTFGYTRHFRSAVTRLLGVDADINRIRRGGHCAHIEVYPIGIHAKKFEAELASPALAERFAGMKADNAGKRLVLSVERMDYTKGILRRLEAIDLFLSRQATTGDVKFVFISVPSRVGVESYQSLKESIESQVGRLNGKYSTVDNTPIHFVHSSIDFTELCALYSLADVALVTPLMDGMNLVAKEYVACQREDPGVLILSEFAGAAEELFNALIINPYDVQSVADALEQALGMTETERRVRMASMRGRVMKFDAQHWARSFVNDLTCREPQQEHLASIEAARRRVADALAEGKRLALFLDYDGTLREFEKNPAAAGPTPAVQHALEGLTRLPNVDVCIISGRKGSELEAWLGNTPFALLAEHGAILRRAGQTEWEDLDRNIRYDWKEELLKVLLQFEGSTPGSFVEQKRTSLVWHYRKADPEFGWWKAALLTEELASLTANQPIEIRHGNKIVEVAATEVNKGAAVMRLIEGEAYDLVLCAGDDQTDESMFRLDLPNFVSIKVGDGDTLAQIRASGPAAFRRFLEQAFLAPALK